MPNSNEIQPEHFSLYVPRRKNNHFRAQQHKEKRSNPRHIHQLEVCVLLNRQRIQLSRKVNKTNGPIVILKRYNNDPSHALTRSVDY